MALETFRATKDAKRRAEAVALLGSTARHWDDLVAVTEPVYPERPVIHWSNENFPWKGLRGLVQEDIVVARKGK